MPIVAVVGFSHVFSQSLRCVTHPTFTVENIIKTQHQMANTKLQLPLAQNQ